MYAQFTGSKVYETRTHSETETRGFKLSSGSRVWLTNQVFIYQYSL